MPSTLFFDGISPIDRDYLDPDRFGIGVSKGSDAVRILTHFIRDLLVARHLFRVGRVITLFFRRDVECRVGMLRLKFFRELRDQVSPEGIGTFDDQCVRVNGSGDCSESK